MKKIKTILKPVIFVIIFALIFSYLTELFSRKTLTGDWNHTTKISGFYNEKENEFDIIYFGSSNTYCSFNPLVIYEETGLKSYVFASQQQPVWASYYYIKDALITQKPKLLIMDALMFSKDQEYYDDGVNYSFMDDIPLSKNKIDLAFASAPFEDGVRLLINFIKYHSRWNELTKEDYEFNRKDLRDYLKGYVYLDNTFKEATYPKTDVFESAPLAEKELEYLNKIIKLSKEENIPLLLVKTPSNATYEEQMLFNTVRDISKEQGVDFVNYNLLYEDIGLLMDEDFYDKSHLNYKGAEKFSRYFARYTLSDYNLSPASSDTLDWENDLIKYYKLKEL